MSTTTPMPTTSTSAVPSSQPSTPSSTGPQNSPLLFFVALGFGVVFTNLWIIVGVKYCFRYNARNRARQQDESGEPIDLANMTQHRRRRREKKLMTVDEVNDRFPVTKYKTWVSSRAAQGLPTEGGVSQSRAASVRDAEGVIEPVGESSKSVITADVASTSEALPSTPTTSGPVKDAASPQSRLSEARTNEETTAPADAVTEKPSDAAGTAPAAGENATETLPVATRLATTTSVDDDEEDAIAAAVPGADAMLEAPGDTCAICIDTLEDEDDVRGLSCGHAFHAVCIDPWLMNRRACCPLCKADYYVPKPRPQLPEGQEGDSNAPATTLDQIVPRRPSLAVGVPAGGISRYVPRLTGRVDTLPPERRSQLQAAGTNSRGGQEPPGIISERFMSIFRRGGNASEPASQAEAPAAAPAPTPAPASAEPSSNTDTEVAETTRTRRWAPSMPHWRRNRNNDSQITTPGQLEAGTS